MALHGSTVNAKIILDPLGTPTDVTPSAIYDSFSPNVATEVQERKGIGGIVKKRIKAHSYKIDVRGDVTKADFLIAALDPASVFEIQVHDHALQEAVIETLGISCSEDDTLQFKTSFQGKGLKKLTISVDDEVPSGTIDGTNKTFTTANTPIVAGSFSALIDGVSAITDNGDGTLSDGGAIDYETGEFTLATAPTTSITVDYEYGTSIEAMTDPGTFFVLADSTISFDGSTNQVTAFELNAERDVTAVRGTNLDPQDFSKSSFNYSGNITLSPSSSLRDLLLGARVQSDPKFTFEAVFQDDPSSPTVTIRLTMTGMVASEASADISADSPIEIPVNFDAESLVVANS